MTYTLKTFSQAIAKFGHSNYDIEQKTITVDLVDHSEFGNFINVVVFEIENCLRIFKAQSDTIELAFDTDGKELFVFSEENQTVGVCYTLEDGCYVYIDLPADVGIQFINKILEKMLDRNL